MTKGKPWDINEERQLRQLVEEGKSVEEISRIMVKTLDAIKQKMFDLKLKVVKEEKTAVGAQNTIFSSSKLVIPRDLPNVEETLLILAAAMLKSTEAGLSKEEVNRLKVVGLLADKYKIGFADYLDYRGIELRLDKVEAKLSALDKKPENTQSGTSQN